MEEPGVMVAGGVGGGAMGDTSGIALVIMCQNWQGGRVEIKGFMKKKVVPLVDLDRRHQLQVHTCRQCVPVDITFCQW